MRLRAFQIVYESDKIVISSLKEKSGSYTLRLLILNSQEPPQVSSFPTRERAVEEVLRLLAVYTLLTATQRRSVGRKVRRNK